VASGSVDEVVARLRAAGKHGLTVRIAANRQFRIRIDWPRKRFQKQRLPVVELRGRVRSSDGQTLLEGRFYPDGALVVGVTFFTAMLGVFAIVGISDEVSQPRDGRSIMMAAFFLFLVPLIWGVWLVTCAGEATHLRRIVLATVRN